MTAYATVMADGVGREYVHGRPFLVLFDFKYTLVQYGVWLFDDVYTEYVPDKRYTETGNYMRKKSLQRIWSASEILGMCFGAASTIYVACLKSENSMHDGLDNMIMVQPYKASIIIINDSISINSIIIINDSISISISIIINDSISISVRCFSFVKSLVRSFESRVVTLLLLPPPRPPRP